MKNNTLAVIRTGGKQYLVTPGKKIKIEKINLEKDSSSHEIGKEEITFKEVLLLVKDGKVEIGKPLLEKVKVVGKIIKEAKGEKVIVFKYKAKKREKTKKGHRQIFNEVEILRIES